jgi:hypothetical protein
MIAVKALGDLLVGDLRVRGKGLFLEIELFGDLEQEGLALFLGHFEVAHKCGVGGGLLLVLEIAHVCLLALVVG